MRDKKRTICALVLSVLCCFAVFGGCASGGKTESRENDAGQESQVDTVQEALDSEKGAEEAENGNGRVGEFSMQDIEGETYTQEMFADYDLTMINVFTTWCTPCINEIPDLQKLRDDMADKGVNVVGIALDCMGGSGSTDEEAVGKAKILAEQTGVSYPFLIPNKSYLNGRLLSINAVPETFFVDKDGNIVGETYVGSRSLEDWKDIVETELKEVVQ